MKADIIRRIVRAIAEGSQDDLIRLADKVVASERRRGHERLADELQGILDHAAPRETTNPERRALQQLPMSKRGRELLVTFHDRESLEHHMVLPPEVEHRFVRIEREYAARERLEVYGLRPRKTVLLYGPPGCGKSLAAKRLAWNAGLPLLKVRFDTLVSSYFGESASNLRSVFDAARNRPCVLLLDECDFIATSRVGSRDVGEVSRIVNTLLQLMEEYDAPGLLVATTNVQDALDPALFRRFDDVFKVPLPGKNEIDSLLRLTLSSLKLSPKIRWSPIVESLDGASAAQVVKCAMDAAKLAVLEGDKEVKASHVMQAIEEVGPGTSPR